MKPGKEYELFAYQKFKQLFVEAAVKHDDHILGEESGLLRQIDVSIRQPVGDGQELLYIVQCKDRPTTKADIKVLGEFASVIQDVRAAKGFLLCTAGFAKSNHQYALTKGIELVTLEDIESEKWTTEVEIPLVYTLKDHQYKLHIAFAATQELVDSLRGREVFEFALSSLTLVRAADLAPASLPAYVQSSIDNPDFVGLPDEHIDLWRPGYEIQLNDMWLPVSELAAVVNVKPRRYLKFLRPDEYSHLRDHVRDEVLPLHAKVSNVPMDVNDTFIELPDGEVPVTPGLWLDFEKFTQIEMNGGLGPQP